MEHIEQALRLRKFMSSRNDKNRKMIKENEAVGILRRLSEEFSAEVESYEDHGNEHVSGKQLLLRFGDASASIIDGNYTFYNNPNEVEILADYPNNEDDCIRGDFEDIRDYWLEITERKEKETGSD